jgi:hypothetical protein
MSGHPSAADLIEAVRAFLQEIEASLVGREAFHAKVAGNVLGIVERELRLQPDRVEAEVLARIVGESAPLPELRAEACAAFRVGRLTTDTPGVLDDLITAALAKLAVDNPRFSTYRRLKEPTS